MFSLPVVTKGLLSFKRKGVSGGVIGKRCVVCFPFKPSQWCNWGGLKVVRAHCPGKKPAQIKATFSMKVIYIKNLKQSRHEAFLKNLGFRSNTCIEVAYVSRC